jgi:phosphatidylglycerol lysyltransferase
MRSLKKNFARIIGPVIGTVLFLVALRVLHNELQGYHYHDIIHSLKAFSSRSVVAAAFCTLLSYAAMVGYDVLALRYIHHPLPLRRVAITSFISYSISNNIGISVLSAAALRYRLYSIWGLSTAQITRIITFCIVTLWVGYCAVAGTVFLSVPTAIPGGLSFPFASEVPMGLLLAGSVCGYLGLCGFRRTPLMVNKLEIPVPSLSLAITQVVVSSMDWILACSVLFVLLPAGTSLPFIQFLGIFMIAQLAGVISQVPGGLGVFESVIVLMLSTTAPASGIMGSLLVYRLVYYLLPFGTASAVFGIHEILTAKEVVRRAAVTLSHWITFMVPHVLSLTVFLGGTVLLFSGATPAVKERLEFLKDIFPLPVIEVSHFLGSVAGAGLIILARGLQKRMDAAYFLSLVLLASGAVLSLLKGGDYEEAVVLLIVFALLYPCRRYFYRRASLITERFSTGWIVSIVVILSTTVWIGMFSFKHVGYSHDLWWRFALNAEAPRFLRATVGVVAVVLFFSIAKLLRPVQPDPTPSSPEELEKIRTIVITSPDTSANLVFLGDKTLLVNRSNTSFIMYGIEGRSWIAMGDPIGPAEEAAELIWQFHEMCDRHDGWAAFYEAGSVHLPVYLDLGLSLLKLGEEARVALSTFSLEGVAGKKFRYILHKLEREGCSFEIIGSRQATHFLPEFRKVSDAWLKEKNTREKGFSLGSFNEYYLKQFPAGIVRRDGKLLAFATIWPGGRKEELSVDLMRFMPGSPHGVMDYLFIHLMQWGKQQGYGWFNLGMAPFSGLEEGVLAPLWDKIGAFVYHHGEHFYNFQGLRRYKEKFGPLWRPKYLASPGGFALPRILVNIATVVSGGLKGVIAK